MKKNNTIEKGKWQVGMTKDYQGATWVVSGFNAKGTPLWKKQTTKQANSTPGKNQPQPSGKSKDEKQSPVSAAPKQGAQVKTQVKEKYDAPTPKVDYKTKRPADGIEYHVPKEWDAKSPSGQIKRLHRDIHRKTYAAMGEDKLLKILNNTNNSPQIRQLAYEEAAARGIDEDKIDVSGSLQDKWDKIKAEKELFEGKTSTDTDEETWEEYDTAALRGMDADKFVEENFAEGDDGWRYRDNEIIQKEFGKFKTLADRKRYDAFLDYMNRKDPYYRNPEQQMQGLNRLFATFIRGNSPLMVSAGGAGAGKTTGFLKVAEILGLKQFDSDKNQPGDGDYHYFIPGKDISDEKDFGKMLSEHNGKIIVFDDKDRLLVSSANKLVGMMKALADGNPKMRIFENPTTGQPEKFTGKLLFITNKNMDTLNKDEDHKAIMSRGLKHDIRMTINENMELLDKRYKTMGEKYFSDPKEEADWREKVYKYIKSNKDQLDPDKFTVRKFTEIMENIAGLSNTNKLSEENEDAAKVFGSDVDWKLEARSILNKAVNYDDFRPEEIYDGDKVEMLLLYKKNPKKFVEIFGEDFVDILNNGVEATEEDNTEIAESFMNDIGNMSVEEAEDLLFNS